MAAGLVVKARIWREFNLTDDVIGGAVRSGTIAYEDISCRVEQMKPNDRLIQEGYQIGKYAQVECVPSTLLIYENDEFEITYPAKHRYYGHKWRVDAVQYPNMFADESRGILLLTLSHKEYAHKVRA
jgi:hypothetical protein